MRASFESYALLAVFLSSWMLMKGIGTHPGIFLANIEERPGRYGVEARVVVDDWLNRTAQRFGRS
jgi:hypothetical protein